MRERHLKTKRISIERIRRDFQPPENLLDSTVAQYVEAMRRREKLSPIRVYYDGRTYWLADGFHRVAAALIRGRRTITAEVVPGTLADLEAEWDRYLQALRRDLRNESPASKAKARGRAEDKG